MDDLELLERYRRGGEEGAFAELVGRHGTWIYLSARRQLGDEQLAEDAAQGVFLLLVRKAGRLSPNSNLGAWLWGTLRYCISEARRQRSRQRHYEKEAAQMRSEVLPAAGWDEVSPLLDDAVGKLGRKDREVVLLRFYQQKALAEVGRELGISEDAAQKRVERAVGKLREKLAGKGVEVEAGSLGAMVLAHAVEGGPAGLVEKVMAGIGSGAGNGTAGLIAKGAEKMMVMAKVKVTAVVCMAAIAVAGIAAAAGISVVATQPVPVQPSTGRDHLLKQVTAAEQAIVNLHLRHFQLSEQLQDQKSGAWMDTPSLLTGEVWLDGLSDSRARISFDRWIAEWQDGAAPWYEQKTEYGFDGRTGREVQHSGGALGTAAVPIKSCRITNARPTIFADTTVKHALGMPFSSNYARVGRDKLALSRVLQEVGQRNPSKLRMTNEVLDGQEVIAVRWTVGRNDEGEISWWLSPKQGYALLKFIELPDRQNVPAVVLVVTKLDEVAPGIWYPTAGTIERDAIGRPGRVRWSYSASGVTANDPNFDEKVFTVPIPAGYLVDDMVRAVIPGRN